MKTWKIILTATLAVVAAALLVTSVYGYMGGYGYGGYGGFGGMMGGRGMMGGYYGYPNTNPQYPAQLNPTAPRGPYQTVYPYQFGGGCHRGAGYGYTQPPYTYTGGPLNITTAANLAQNYVASLNNPDLTVKEVEEYTANFYIQVTEKSTGTGAFELIVDKYTGSIYPEMGPNMMWNTKYGHMRGFGGMMGGRGWNGNAAPTADMPVKPDQATQLANDYLAKTLPGTTAKDPETFYGYYTLDTQKDGKTTGMLSVNGYTGDVWLHTWHGTFIQDKDYQQ